MARARVLGVRRWLRPDAVGALQRRGTAALDRLWAPVVERRRPGPRATHDPEADPGVAIVTVDFSTTRYLQLMLATLAGQRGLELVRRIVVVDNASRDDPTGFLDALAAAVPRVTVVRRRRFLSHAHGMRAGVAALRRVEHPLPASARATHLLFVDTDVVWRSPEALLDLVAAAVARDAALVGELRDPGPNPRPDIQASLFLVRRDVYDDPAVPPPMCGGSPAYRLQRAIFDGGWVVVDFPTNRLGATLHRGRAGVEAAARHRWHPYARAVAHTPHYMGVPDGAAVWAGVEAAHAPLLDPAGAPALVRLLADRFGTASS